MVLPKEDLENKLMLLGKTSEQTTPHATDESAILSLCSGCYIVFIYFF